jgi:hypothetical protein
MELLKTLCFSPEQQMPTIKVSSPTDLTCKKVPLAKRVSYQSDGDAEPHFDDIDCRKLIQTSTRQWKPQHKIYPEQKATPKICDNFRDDNYSPPNAQRNRNPIKLISRDDCQRPANKSSQTSNPPTGLRQQFGENSPVFTVQTAIANGNGTQNLNVDLTGMRTTISEESLSECSLSESMSCDCKLKSITIQLAKS